MDRVVLKMWVLFVMRISPTLFHLRSRWANCTLLQDVNPRFLKTSLRWWWCEIRFQHTDIAYLAASIICFIGIHEYLYTWVSIVCKMTNVQFSLWGERYQRIGKSDTQKNIPSLSRATAFNHHSLFWISPSRCFSVLNCHTIKNKYYGIILGQSDRSSMCSYTITIILWFHNYQTHITTTKFLEKSVSLTIPILLL